MQNKFKNFLLMFLTGFATFAFAISYSMLIYLAFALVIDLFHIDILTRNIIVLIILISCFSFFSFYISSRKWSFNPLATNVIMYIGLAILLIYDSYYTMGKAFGFILTGTGYESFLGIHLMEIGTTGFPRNIIITTFLWFIPLGFIYYFSKKGCEAKLLNSFRTNKNENIFLSLNLILFFIVSFLMLGNCQLSKYHYLFQGIVNVHSIHNNYKESFTQKKKTEIWREWHINGKLSTITNYVDGQIEGQRLGWYSSGAKEFEEFWVKGGRYSRIVWKENGQIMTKEEELKRLMQQYNENN